MAQQKKTRRVGRPKLPKGAAKGRIVPVRFTPDDLKEIEAAAKKEGFKSMLEWGEAMVKEGKTTKPEVMRVTAE